MNEIDSFFRELSSDYQDDTKNGYAHNIIQNAEQEFKGPSEAQQSREDERKKIHEQIRTLRSSLNKFKNIRGGTTRMANVNATLASKRADIKRKILDLELRLNEISIEEKGINSDPMDPGKVQNNEDEKGKKSRRRKNKTAAIRELTKLKT